MLPASFHRPSLEVYSASIYWLELSHEKPTRQAEKYSPVACLRKKKRVDFNEYRAETDVIKPE